MTLPGRVGEVLRDHVTLENESIDRMYLNAYAPGLQNVGGVVWYLRQHRGQRFASTATVAPMSESFVARIEQFVEEEGLARIKQSHKEGQALRTETTINDTRDFAIGRRLKNLPALRKIGFEANRRLLDVQRISHDCSVGEDSFQGLQRPREVNGQRASGLRFADARVQALLHALLLFVFLARGLSNKDLREQLAPLLGKRPGDIQPGRMTYDLRRLRLHGLIDLVSAHAPDRSGQLNRAFQAAENAVNSWCDQAKIAA